MTFRDALLILLKNADHEMRSGDPHVYLDDALTLFTEVKKEHFNSSAHDELLRILNEWGIDEQGLTIASRIYQNTGLALKKESPGSIRDIEEDGAVRLDPAYEFKIGEHIDKLTTNATVIWAAHFYMTGIIDIISKVTERVRNVKSDQIELGINRLKDAMTLLPDEQSISDAIALANKIRDAVRSEEASRKLELEAIYCRLFLQNNGQASCLHTLHPKVITPDKPKKNSNYAKLAIIGTAVSVLIAVGFFVKSYLIEPSGQPGIDIVRKPVEPQKSAAQTKPAERLPLVEQPKERQTTADVGLLTRTAVKKKRRISADRVDSDQTPKRQEAAAKANRQPAALPDTTTEQEPGKQGNKSFAPHSRDDL